ncbi:inositol monophosphatase family protein [Roseospirillum parvum]|uniref:Inositol-1-monophosphatase n=1 Tax=Roseospirillum parvum TaxID=83401 RepID=A0A1G8A1D4_9PROT|nr:inositol monophosphatase family protein [Roseospirillum parvum]SDH14739.1 myo-inositol-1(or 4)-monophosphatase [Roseospirillum parvum]
MPPTSALLNVMIGAARKAGRGLIRDFGEVEQLQVSEKGVSDFVSTADLKAEKTLKQELSRARPRFGLLMEEGTVAEGAPGEPRFVVDPLDGTTNFLHGIPHFAISIGVEQDGQPIAGVIYNPISDEMYIAEKGRGAFLNDRRLRVSARRRLGEAVVASGIPHLGRGDHAAYLPQLARVMGATAGVRRFGVASLDLAYVAAGRYEGFWETGLKPWDVCAGMAVVREAGGFTGPAIDPEADPLADGDILAANDRLFQPLTDLLRG